MDAKWSIKGRFDAATRPFAYNSDNQSMARDSSTDSNLKVRQKLILSGLYLSKFDSEGLKSLGFESFTEAFNVIGYALGSQPASIKNYRDEFDPLFPNQRKGWHKRPIRQYCRDVYDHFKYLDLADFTGLVRSFFNLSEGAPLGMVQADMPDDGTSAFAQRLVTGLAAERYFVSVHGALPTFQGLTLENTTTFGCGYDFRFRSSPESRDFLAVEVKGMKDKAGSISLTQKEYDAASLIKDRFFLFVVRNFRERPYHSIFQDPVHSGIDFRRTERVTVQISWLTSV